MSKLTRNDLPKLAELVTDVGGRLGQPVDRNGDAIPVIEAAWLTANDFERGSKAANLDPDGAGGNRWETDDDGVSWAVPHDPVGEAATATDPTSLLSAKYRRALARLEDAAIEVRDLVGMLVPVQPGFEIKPCGTCGSPRPVRAKTRAKDLTATNVAAAGWCASCYRDNQHLEPIPVDAKGNRIYSSACRWCGAFKGDFGVDPPVELLRLRHQGRRITVADIERWVPAPAREKRKGKRGWRRKAG